MPEKLLEAERLLVMAAALMEEAGWSGLAAEVAEFANAVDVAAS